MGAGEGRLPGRPLRRRLLPAARGRAVDAAAAGGDRGLADQPPEFRWAPPSALDPWDEGAELEAQIDGDLDQVGYGQLAHVADRRMMRAVLRGEAAEALRWRRVRDVMWEEQQAMDRFVAHEEEYDRMMAHSEAIRAANAAPDDPARDT